MENEKKTISQLKLKVLLAKYIKKRSKELKTENRVIIPIVAAVAVNDTGFFFGEEWYYVDGFVSPEDCIQKAFNETASKGVCFSSNGTYYVMLYGKPSPEFNRLTRLVYKYSGVTLNWDDVKTEYTHLTPDKNKYLCYDEQQCKIATDFIKQHRGQKDKLAITLPEAGDLVFRRMLNIAVVSPSGNEKVSKNVLV